MGKAKVPQQVKSHTDRPERGRLGRSDDEGATRVRPRARPIPPEPVDQDAYLAARWDDYVAHRPEPALVIECHYCGAEPGEPCLTERGSPRDVPHESRLRRFRHLGSR